MTVMKPPLEQNGLPRMVNIMQVPSTKSQSVRKASRQPAIMGSCLPISQMWQPCLPNSRLVEALCFMAPYYWANGGSVDVFVTW